MTSMTAFAKSWRSVATLVVGAIALTACEKNAVQDITGTLPGAQIKFFNFGVNAPGVNFYANDTKISAISSTTGVEAVTGVNSGGAASGGLYSAVAPGAYTIQAKIAAATDKDLTISSAQTTLEDGKSYSFFVSGIYNTTAKSAEAFVVEDPIPTRIAADSAYVRFVNAISNSTPQALFALNTTTNVEYPVGGAVAYKAGGAFTQLPPGTYNIVTRTVGSSTAAISRNTLSFVAGRVYTIASRGDMTVTSTTATTRPQLDITANR